jgi:hypothetical protein
MFETEKSHFRAYFVLGTLERAWTLSPPSPHRKPVKCGDVLIVDMSLRFAFLLVLLLPVPVVWSGSYSYEMTWTYENMGGEVYILTQKDMGVPVFINNTHQQVKMTVPYSEYEFVKLNEGFVKAVNTEQMVLEPGELFNITARFNITSQAIIPPKVLTPGVFVPRHCH